MKPLALLVVAVLLGGPGCKKTKELRADLDRVRADTGDVMSSATYQRFAVRREAVAAMKADLRSLAAAESAFVADSGRATVNPPRSYWSAKGSGNSATIRIERDRWVANMSNVHTSMSCSLTALLDTVTWRYHPGVPVCAGWTPGESLAIANDTAHQYGYIPSPEVPPAPAMPHKRLDWGPANNTPPGCRSSAKRHVKVRVALSPVRGRRVARLWPARTNDWMRHLSSRFIRENALRR